MRFFVPGCETRDDAESVWQATRESATRLLRRSVSDRRIFATRYLVCGIGTTATIGEPEAITGERIQVILESDCFLICTENHGVARGNPIFTGTPEEVVLFDVPEKRPVLIRLPLPSSAPRLSRASSTRRRSREQSRR